MTTPVINLDTLTLDRGAHDDIEDGACLLEATSYLAGEAFSDSPRCVSRVIAAYGRRLNDRLPTDERQKLKPYISRLIGTATTDQALEDRRACLASDWAIRTAIPRWLDLAEQPALAAELRALDPISSREQAAALAPRMRQLRDEMWTARRDAKNRLADHLRIELQKRGLPAAVAVAVAAAAVDAAASTAAVAAAAVAVAVDAADAAVDAAAAVAAVAVAAAAVDAAADAAAAVAAVDAAAAVAAVDDAAAVAAVDAVAVGPFSYSKVYAAVREEIDKRIAARTFAPGWDEVAVLNQQEAIELLGRMIDVA